MVLILHFFIFISAKSCLYYDTINNYCDISEEAPPRPPLPGDVVAPPPRPPPPPQSAGGLKHSGNNDFMVISKHF